MESCTVWITEIPVHFSKNAVLTECQNKASKWIIIKLLASCFVSCCSFASPLHKWDGGTAGGLFWWKHWRVRFCFLGGSQRFQGRWEGLVQAAADLWGHVGLEGSRARQSLPICSLSEHAAVLLALCPGQPAPGAPARSPRQLREPPNRCSQPDASLHMGSN